MDARDIPALGGLLDTVIVYVSTLGRFLRRPFGFVDGIRFDDPEELKRASKFLARELPSPISSLRRRSATTASRSANCCSASLPCFASC